MSDATPTPDAGANRLAKVIARAGLCSRREAEEWITAGRVTVNGKPVRTPAFNVIDSDKVMVDGNPLVKRSGTRVWLYHKPAGLVVTERDPEGRETIFEALEKHGLPRVLTVGRLDINTEGLLLLTNDGGLKRVLELPATGWLRRYRVRAFGNVDQKQLDKLKDGVEVDGVKYGPIEAELEREQGSNVWITIALREGKNREIKNVLSAIGLQVNRLIRTSYGPFQLGDIPIGAVTVVRARVLRDQLGKKLAEQAGVDFDSPLPEDAEPAQLVRSPNARVRKTAEGTLEKAPKTRGRKEGPRKPAGPRSDKPRRAPERKGNFERFERPEKPEPETEKRRVHFGGERGAEEFEFRARRAKSDEDGGRDFKSGKGDRPFNRDGGSRDDRPRSDRKFSRDDRPRGDRPSGDRKFSRDDRPRDDRPRGDRTFNRDDKPRGDRPFGDRPRGDKPRGDRPYGDRPRGDRPAGDRPRGERSFNRDDKPRGDKPFRKDDRPRGDKPFGDRPPRRDGSGGKPGGGRSFGDKPGGGRPAGGARGKPGGKPGGGFNRGGKPDGGRSGGGGGRPGGGRPSGGPRKGPPRGSRS